MKRSFLQVTATVIFLISVVQFLACSLSQQPNLKELTSVNKPSTNKPMNIAEENFANAWKSKFDETAAELERNRNLWKQNQIADYDFVVSKSAHGYTDKWTRLPVLIKIRDDEKISIEKVEKDKDYVIYSRTDGFENFDTVDKLFNYLRQELEKGRILGIKYHKDLGYPKNVVILDSHDTHGRIIVVEKIEVVKNI